MRRVAVGDGNVPDRTPDGSVHVLDPTTGDRLSDKRVPARFPTTVACQVTISGRGRYLEESRAVVGGGSELEPEAKLGSGANRFGP